MPERLWSLYVPDTEETTLNYRINNTEEQPWWSYQPLQNLDLSSNCLTDIPSDIKMFENLLVLNVSKQNIFNRLTLNDMTTHTVF